MRVLVSNPDGLHPSVVLEFPLRWVRYVLVIEVASAALCPTDRLHLGMSVEEDGIVGEELPGEVEEGGV